MSRRGLTDLAVERCVSGQVGVTEDPLELPAQSHAVQLVFHLGCLGHGSGVNEYYALYWHAVAFKEEKSAQKD